MKVLIAEEQDEFAQMMKKILEKNCFSRRSGTKR